VRAVTGQSADFPGAVVAGGLVFTSGLVAPSLLSRNEPIPSFADQAGEVLGHLEELLADAGSDLGRVLRVEAFLTDAAYLPRWNDAFSCSWTGHRPARSTIVTGLALPGALIEIQAVALLG
jgi:2-iminobutanoate/2-iminopropanoate deaminase